MSVEYDNSKRYGCCGSLRGQRSDFSVKEPSGALSNRKNKAVVDLAKGVKICFLGEAGVGKSSILNRYIRDEFHEGEAPTIGAAFATKTHIRADQITKFEIWDTAGQERYHSLAPMYYRGSLAALIVYDITQEYTFEKAKSWVMELRSNCPTISVMLIVGCKCDLEEMRKVPKELASSFAEENGCFFMECSAKTGLNVPELFDTISRLLWSRYDNSHSSKELPS